MNARNQILQRHRLPPPPPPPPLSKKRLLVCSKASREPIATKSMSGSTTSGPQKTLPSHGFQSWQVPEANEPRARALRARGCWCAGSQRETKGKSHQSIAPRHSSDSSGERQPVFRNNSKHSARRIPHGPGNRRNVGKVPVRNYKHCGFVWMGAVLKPGLSAQTRGP